MKERLTKFLLFKLDLGALDELTFHVTVSYFFLHFKNYESNIIHAIVHYHTIKSKMKATPY